MTNCKAVTKYVYDSHISGTSYIAVSSTLIDTALDCLE